MNDASWRCRGKAFGFPIVRSTLALLTHRSNSLYAPMAFPQVGKLGLDVANGVGLALGKTGFAARVAKVAKFVLPLR